MYHWTDGPWVYSRQWLLILDPHEWCLSAQTGHPCGARWDVVENIESPEIQNHLKTFSQFDLEQGQPLDQTIIRIPLRTSTQAAKSKLFDCVIHPSDIRRALEEFGEEIKDGGLLFLKHVRKVTIRVDRESILKLEMLEVDKIDTR